MHARRGNIHAALALGPPVGHTVQAYFNVRYKDKAAQC